MATRQTAHDDTDVASPRVSQHALTIGLCATIVAIAFETISVATAMPVAARELDGLRYYAWAFSLFLIGMLFATVVCGRLSDRIGPAKPLLGGLVIFLAGLVVSGTAQDMAELLAGRLVQGLGSGTMNVAIFVCVAQAYSLTQRPKIFTYISTAWVLPSFVGPPAAAWLTEHLSWHWVFLAVIPLVIFGGVMALPSLRRMIRRHQPGSSEVTQKPAPLWAAAMLCVATASLQLAGQRLDWAGLGLLIAGLAMLLAALPQLMPPGFLRFRRGLSQVIQTRGLLPGAFFGAEAFVPLMLVEQRSVPLVQAGAVLTFGAVGWTVGSWLQSRPWLLIRRDVLITLGCGLVALGLALVALVAFLPVLPYGLVAVSWVLGGLGMGLATSSTSLAVMSLSAAGEQGRNGSSLNVYDALGSAIFIGIAGTIFAALHPSGNLALTFGVVEGSMAVVALLAVLTSLRIGAVRNEFSPAG
ncbi:MAG TPA: MFS transporter [Propionibacteriaceae bacterium]|nr:MFS transporter [Propionibacteriaceae bacterium]